MMYFYFASSLLVLLLYLYLKKCSQFWKNRNVPSTSPNLLFGDITEALFCVRRANLIYQDIYKAFPHERYVGFYEFLKPVLLIRDPKLIESILVKDYSHFSETVWMPNGEKNSVSKNLAFTYSEDWRNVRRKLTTIFSTNKLKTMLVMMNKCADTLDNVLSEKCQYDAVDVREIFARYTVDMMSCCYFGFNTNALTEPKSNLLEFCKSIMKPSVVSLWMHFLRSNYPELFYWLVTKLPTSRYQQTIEDMIKMADELRKSGSLYSKDLVQLMLDLRDLSQQKAYADKNSNDVTFDDSAVKSSMRTAFVGTFEGSSTALTFILYELALHPKMQQRLRNEVQSILGANGGVATYDALKKMNYCEMIINETLRKDATIPFLRRVCTLPYKIPDSSLSLNVGQTITIPLSAIHLDEQYYPNPNKFDPDRFTPENIAVRPSHTFLPFTDGPRMCPGKRFAKMNLKLLLVRILSKYEICTCSKTEIPAIMDIKSPFSFPQNPILLRIRKI